MNQGGIGREMRKEVSAMPTVDYRFRPLSEWPGKRTPSRAHPDAGGSNELMAKVNRARDFIERSVTR